MERNSIRSFIGKNIDTIKDIVLIDKNGNRQNIRIPKVPEAGYSKYEIDYIVNILYNLILENQPSVDIDLTNYAKLDQGNLFIEVNTFEKAPVSNEEAVAPNELVTLGQVTKLLGGASVTYTNTEPVPVGLGGIAKGVTFNNMSLQDVITMLLYPYQQPAITNFTSNLKQQYKLGESTASNLVLTWNTSNQNNVKDDSIVFYFNNKQLPKEKFPKQGSKAFTIQPVVLNTQGSININMEMYDIKNKKFTKTITLTWLNGIYYGNNSKQTVTVDEILAFNTIDANSIGRDYRYPGGGYKYIAFPATWNDPSQFVDPATNFDVPMVKQNNVTITNAFGVSQNYKVYRSVNVLNGDITIRIKA